MSVRHRSIAGAPRRSASEAAEAIEEMVIETLSSSNAIETADVRAELAEAHVALRMLVAGKHLGDRPVVLVAEPLHLRITVVSATAALKLDERPGKVPGAATATDWTLHLPSVDPIRDWISKALDGLDHLTDADSPAAKALTKEGALDLSSVDAEELRRVAGRDQ